MPLTDCWPGSASQQRFTTATAASEACTEPLPKLGVWTLKPQQQAADCALLADDRGVLVPSQEAQLTCAALLQIEEALRKRKLRDTPLTPEEASYLASCSGEIAPGWPGSLALPASHLPGSQDFGPVLDLAQACSLNAQPPTRHFASFLYRVLYRQGPGCAHVADDTCSRCLGVGHLSWRPSRLHGCMLHQSCKKGVSAGALVRVHARWSQAVHGLWGRV